MEVKRTKGSNTAEAPEPDQEIAPTQASQEARKRRFHALLPSTENPSRHRQLSRPPGYLSLPRTSDFFYDTPGSTAAFGTREFKCTVQFLLESCLAASVTLGKGIASRSPCFVGM